MRNLFLLGAHRSGTTWLHQILASSSEVSYLSYGEIRQAIHRGLQPLSKQQIQQALLTQGENRGFDSIAVGVDLPEEYGFLLEKGGFGYYSTRPISNTNFLPLQSLISSKQHQNPEHRYLVLKNPVDFYDGALHLSRVFPNSFLLCLHRHPWSVFRSQVRAWRELTDQYNPYIASLDSNYAQRMADPRQRTALQFMLRQRKGLEALLASLAEGCNYHFKHQEALDAAGLRLRYEDLFNDPTSELRRVGAALKLSDLETPRPGLTIQFRQLDDDPLVQEVFMENAHRFATYCDWLDYSLNPTEET